MIRVSKKYAVGHDDHQKSWGLKMWDSTLQQCLEYEGTMGDRILIRTQQGLKPIYRRWKNQWIKMKHT